MNILERDQVLKLLIAVGGCVVMVIAFVVLFGFDVKAGYKVPAKVGFINIGSIFNFDNVPLGYFL